MRFSFSSFSPVFVRKKKIMAEMNDPEPLDLLAPFYTTEMDPAVVINTPIIEHLNEYQVASLQKMVHKEASATWGTDKNRITILASCVGFLANKVGTGKTRIGLALALSDVYPTSVDDAVYDSVTRLDGKAQRLIAGTLNYRINGKGRCNPATVAVHLRQTTDDKDTLIVVPSALFPQWKIELQKLAIDYTETPTPEVIITLPTHRVFIRVVNNMTIKPESFCRVIYDECDALLHPNPGKKSRHFTWLLSATPAELRSERYPFSFGKELKQTLTHMVPNYELNYPWVKHSNILLAQIPLMVKASDDYIASLINLPAVVQARHVVSKPILRQLVPEAPLIMDTTARIYLQRLEGELLQAEARQGATATEAARAALKAEIDRISGQIENLADDQGNCPICLDEPPITPVMTDCCNQTFCMHCLLHCDLNRCPYCRKAGFRYMPLATEQKEDKNQERLPTRDEAMLSIIEPQKTYLLVGDNTDIGRILNVLHAHNIAASFMNKTHHQITALKNRDIQVLIFDCREFGSGLDLTFVDEIIIYANLHSCHYTQVTGRLCRLGRERDVTVHTFTEEIN